MRRVEPKLCAASLASVRALPEAALIQAHSFLLLSWITFQREGELVQQGVLQLALAAMKKHPYDRFMLACVGSLFRSLAQASLVAPLSNMLANKCIAALHVRVN